MAVIIDGGTTGDSGTHVATGTTEVIASGSFGAGSVQLMLQNNGQEQAPIYTFRAPGAVSVQCTSGAVITVNVIGGQGGVVDVTCNP